MDTPEIGSDARHPSTYLADASKTPKPATEFPYKPPAELDMEEADGFYGDDGFDDFEDEVPMDRPLAPVISLDDIRRQRFGPR